MAQVAPNADDYAAPRQNIFFPGVVPSLDGQCVSLAKWFMAEMSEVPNPQAARGDARYVGKTLVAQGHAVEVPYDQRRRGDIVCLEYGLYGHIYVQLSGGRVFEENVNWPGVASKIVDGARVYASRIGSDSESWRHDAHVYRLKTYKETTMAADSMTREEVILNYSQQYDVPEDQVNMDVVKAFTGKGLGEYLRFVQQDPSYIAHFKAVNNPPSGGNVPAGTYLKVNKSDIIEAK